LRIRAQKPISQRSYLIVGGAVARRGDGIMRVDGNAI
jgi:hypothetical protein